jgi:hypothetical protein
MTSIIFNDKLQTVLVVMMKCAMLAIVAEFHWFRVSQFLCHVWNHCCLCLQTQYSNDDMRYSGTPLMRTSLMWPPLSNGASDRFCGRAKQAQSLEVISHRGKSWVNDLENESDVAASTSTICWSLLLKNQRDLAAQKHGDFTALATLPSYKHFKAVDNFKDTYGYHLVPCWPGNSFIGIPIFWRPYIQFFSSFKSLWVLILHAPWLVAS